MKVLVVDDDFGVRKLIERSLAIRQFEVVSQASPRDLLRSVRNERPDVVLLDAHFNEGAIGLDLCSALKKDAATAHIPVIMMSGKSEYLEYQRAAGDRGASGFLRKPFLLDELTGAIRNAVKGESQKSFRLKMPQSTVLCIEDDEGYRELVLKSLGLAGIHCVFAPTIRRAWECLNACAPDLILLDALLPDGSGLDFCRELRGRGYAVTVVVVTGQRRVLNRGEWFEVGADQCYPKIFDAKKLRRIVEAQLRRREWEKPLPATVSDLKFDLDRRVVVYRGQTSRPLSIKQWQILRLLCANPDIILSRQRIHSEILCFHGLSGAELALNTFMLHLRRKLPPSLASAIETVKGEGYRIALP